MPKLKYIRQPFKDAPDFTEFGFSRAVTLTNWAFHKLVGGQYVTNEIDMPTVIKNAALESYWENAESLPIIFDIETLKTATRDRPLRDHVHDQIADVLTHYRQHPLHQGKALGLYSILPHRDYWRAIGTQGDAGLAAWKEENRYPLESINDQTLRPDRGLWTYVDRVYPSLYFWYPERLNTFQQYADANIQEAAIYGKPIIAYVSPNMQQAGYPFWAPGEWAKMLDFIYNHPLIDGVYVWAIENSQQSQWDDSAHWWNETLEVLA